MLLGLIVAKILSIYNNPITDTIQKPSNVNKNISVKYVETWARQAKNIFSNDRIDGA